MNVVEDILFNEIVPKITIEEIIILSLTCKSLHRTIASKNFFNPFADRTRRLRKLEQSNQECGVTLDRMYYIHPLQGRPLIMICVKFHMSDNCNPMCGGNTCFANPVIMTRYTNDEWITCTDKRSEYKYNSFGRTNTLYQIFFLDEIKFFALKIKVNVKESTEQCIETKREYIMGGLGIYQTLINHIQWDNNNGWNYCTSRQYHWIPDLVLTQPSGFDNDGHYLPHNWIQEDILTEEEWKNGTYIKKVEIKSH